VIDSPRTLCGFKLCNALSYLFGPRIESFELPQNRIVRRSMLYMHSTEELGRHLRCSDNGFDEQPFDVADLPAYIDGQRYPQARGT
tara:strand:+ start:1247 stop:1504 length:258 start_codon:yes stop_codon:yes gene_type:complete